jgi:hypothetical protein
VAKGQRGKGALRFRVKIKENKNINNQVKEWND